MLFGHQGGFGHETAPAEQPVEGIALALLRSAGIHATQRLVGASEVQVGVRSHY